MTARMRTDIVLGTLAGIAAGLAQIEGLEQYYFEGLHALVVEQLKKWPKMPFRNERCARRYLARLESRLSRIERNLFGKFDSLPALLNWLMAEIVSLQEDLNGSPRAALLDPIISMLEQYIETTGGFDPCEIDKGLGIARLFSASACMAPEDIPWQ